MGIFGKKKEPAAPAQPVFRQSMPSTTQNVPVDRVKDLSSKGMPESEIIRTLREEGFQITDIDMAMKEALRNRVSPEPYRPPDPTQQISREPMRPPQQSIEPDVAPAPLGPSRMQENVPGQPQRPREPELPPLEDAGSMDFGNEQGNEMLNEQDLPPPEKMQRKVPGRHGDIEEIAEAIIEERLQSFNEQMKFFGNELDALKSKMDDIEKRLSQKSTESTGESKNIETKIDSYQQSIAGLNSRIESMETALKSSLTPMLESMRSLSDTVKLLKEKKKPE